MNMPPVWTSVPKTTATADLPYACYPAATAIGIGAIRVNWTDNNTWDTGCRVERRASSNAVWATIATLGPAATLFTDQGLAAGQTYWYRILVFNGDGHGPPGAIVSAQTPRVPATPANLTAAATATNRIALVWSDMSDNETHFELQRRVGLAGAWQPLAMPGADSTAYSDTGLTPNRLHCYRLRAVNAVGASGFTPEACATTPPLPDSDCGYTLAVTRTNLTLGDMRFMTATYLRGPDAAGDVGVVVELSTNLVSGWTGTMLPVDATPTGGVTRVRVRSDAPYGSRQAEFIRLRARPHAP